MHKCDRSEFVQTYNSPHPDRDRFVVVLAGAKERKGDDKRVSIQTTTVRLSATCTKVCPSSDKYGKVVDRDRPYRLIIRSIRYSQLKALVPV